jgi:hypothetical protein
METREYRGKYAVETLIPLFRLAAAFRNRMIRAGATDNSPLFTGSPGCFESGTPRDLQGCPLGDPKSLGGPRPRPIENRRLSFFGVAGGFSFRPSADESEVLAKAANATAGARSHRLQVGLGRPWQYASLPSVS